MAWDLRTAAGLSVDLAPAATVSGSAKALALLSWGWTDSADPRLRGVGDQAAWQAVLDDHFVP